MNKFASMNTLRNQIFLGFMVVMVFVLASVGLFTYDQVSVLLRNNAEKHIQQTAVQASGKLDALLKQIDTLTAQVATNATIQRLLTQEVEGRKISFGERQLLQQEVSKFTAYATGIQSLELFTTDYRMLFPLTDVSLDNRVSEEWIKLADEGKGRLIWYGMDPRYPNAVIAIRHIRLIDKSFSHAGYLMVHMDKNYFELTDSEQEEENDVRESMGLVDASGQIIASDFSKELDIGTMLAQGRETVQIDEEEYIAVQKKSEETNWRIIILTPARYATEGISILRTAIIVSVMVGGLLFLIFTFILSTMITRPILNLIKAMRIAKLGTLKPIDVSTSSIEINELNNTYNQMVVSLNELIEVVYQKEIIQSRTELKALQAQINPHFLFNTLEAFYWALDEKGEEELSQVVVAMSGLFRYVIARPDEDEWVTISDELDHAERYLKIMDMRLVDRLSWRIAADDVCRRTPIPKLLIQPLVENAITHGVEQQIGPGTVEIIVMPSIRTGYTRIEVSDNGPGMDTDKVQQLYASMQIGYSRSAKGNGVGIANVDRRLKLYYESDTDGLVIRSEKGRGTTIAFEIPKEYGSES